MKYEITPLYKTIAMDDVKILFNEETETTLLCNKSALQIMELLIREKNYECALEQFISLNINKCNNIEWLREDFESVYKILCERNVLE
ncbi:MAG: hypothetical protein ACOXZM_09595 [Eubacteriales bacterium]